MTLTVWTVGHSTRSLADFLAILRPYRIEAVVDVRRFPGSSRQPQYQKAVLEAALRAAGIDYLSLAALGGRRAPAANTTNTAWRHPAFRGYADHLASEEFATGLFELLMVASGLRTAVMCAEVLWWRCHRRMIADVLVSLGARVSHIMDAETSPAHRLRAPARLVGGVLTYAPERQANRRRSAAGAAPAVVRTSRYALPSYEGRPRSSRASRRASSRW
jgi:uncharacterized protein (DUF488 family)